MTGRHRRADSDDALIEQVGELFERLDPIPESVYTAALEAVLLRSPLDGEELLRIVGDSAVDELLVGMRGERSVGVRRVLEFADAFGSMALHIEMSSGGNLCGLVEASVIPPLILLRSTGIVYEAAVDELGSFRFEELPGGPIRVELNQNLGGRIVTPWFAG